MFNPQIQFTADGSHTLYIPEMEEHYHSVNGAIQESLHVYIEAGLNQCKKETINVLEFGFGTGLNAFLTIVEAEKRNLNCKSALAKINYTTIEKYPLPVAITNQLNYAKEFAIKYQPYFSKIHTCEWGNFVKISTHFQIKKIQSDFSDFQFEDNYDVIFYDAFAPDKQSDVWPQEIFNKIFQHSNPNAILTTYCAKGNIRRMMQAAGFQTERIPGPPGKREMLRARK
ncbi:MAG: tRNA (5-methylaminomethyl-2-thiouridine)(34)-methyltransferase MnmD [Dysgonamonadaceae bacterium]|jgi:tRNA U34 5-methylaminomethyl-2-thiouridine-forming methyltransferase MnmC|nr:tRNA (5-methylaminomethyl-2-thiouridine)(34)-methyltransferase MnmD [Dysgonamonadaceae bacterium]